MKIVNNQHNISNAFINSKNNQVNFKRLPASSINKIKTLATNEANKHIFKKLSIVTGLSSIITWVNSLKNNEAQDTIQKLDIIDAEWTQKGNNAILDPQLQGKFLNITSELNTLESAIETKHSNNNDSIDININSVPQEAMEVFLSPEANEKFLSISTEKNLKSIEQSTNALMSAAEEQREKALNALDSKINALFESVDKLKKDDSTSNIYEKISNILRMFVVTNFVNNENIDENIEKPHQKEESITTESVNTEELKEVKPSSEENQEKVNTGDEVDYNASSEAQKILPGVSVIENPELKAILERNLEQNKETATKTYPKEFIYTEENKDFIDNTFKPYFEKNNSNISPEVYANNIDIIMDIYNYAARKENVDVLYHISRTNFNKELSLYKEYCEGDVTNFEFLNFLKLQNFKHIKSGGYDITKDEFNLIYSLKQNGLIAYIDAPVSPKGKSIKIQFTRNASAEERLKVLSDIYKIAFAKSERDLMSPETPELITANIIVHEIAINLARALEKNKKDDYENLLKYLKIEKEDIVQHLKDYGIAFENGAVNADESKEVEIEDFKILTETIEKYLNMKLDKTRMNSLEKLLNYKKFKGFMSSPHARMRLVARKILNDIENYNLQLTTLNKKLKDTITQIKSIIESQPYILLQDYITNSSEKVKNPHCGARIIINNVTMGINNNGEIHTIYYED